MDIARTELGDTAPSVLTAHWDPKLRAVRTEVHPDESSIQAKSGVAPAFAL
jgi:hypothetical protein